MNTRIVSFAFLLIVAAFQTSFGQTAPPEPPRVYTGSFGGGFALTGGNTDTQNFNLTLGVVRDPKTRNVMKANAVYLRGDQNDVLNLDRTAVNLRDEFTISGRTFAFGQLDYLRDQFKQIIFLWAPVGGLGFKAVNTDSTLLALDGGAGGLWEKNPGRDTRSSASLTAGQRFQHKISTTATFTESLATLWKTNDFADSLTNFSVGVTTSLSRNLELKVEFLDSYKNKPPRANVKKNDTAFVTAFVLKF